MNEIETVFGSIKLFARPAMKWELKGNKLSLSVCSPRDPDVLLIRYGLAPNPFDWAESQTQILRGVSAFVDYIAITLETLSSSEETSPIGLAGKIFNQGFFLGEHELADYFTLSLEHLEEDWDRWPH